MNILGCDLCWFHLIAATVLDIGGKSIFLYINIVRTAISSKTCIW